MCRFHAKMTWELWYDIEKRKDDDPMKKILLAFVCVCLLLGGCANQKKPSAVPDASTDEESRVPDADDSDARIAYYEQLVTELRREILQVRTELYVARVEYESRIAELEGDKAPEGPLPEHRPSVESQFTYVIQNGSAVITAYTGNEREVSVPDTLGGYPVRAISDRAFADRITLLSVELPDGMTSVGWFAFSGCIALERVVLPASVTSIAYGAFENCPASLLLLCPVNSYAAQYAASYGIATREG